MTLRRRRRRAWRVGEISDVSSDFLSFLQVLRVTSWVAHCALAFQAQGLEVREYRIELPYEGSTAASDLM